MRFGFVLPVILLGLLGVAPAADAIDFESAGASAKAKRCKAPKVPVTVGKRTTCESLAEAFPKPKAVDVRLFYLQRALKFEPRRAVGGKKRKRVRSLQSGFGAAGKRAQKKLLRALPKVLARADRKFVKGLASPRVLGSASASGCEAGVGGPSREIAGVRFSISGPNGGVLEVDSGGLTVKIRYGVCGRSGFGVPECPTAAGAVEASSSSSGEVVVEVWEGDRRLISRSRTNYESRAKAKGKVGADAKLEHVELDYAHEVFIVASGGVVLRGKSERKVRIEMPGGNYAAAGAQARISGDADAVREDGFERVANAAIDDFKAAEPRWSSFERKPHCAEPVFSPGSGALKLRKGDSGQLSVSAQSKSGGTAAAARWALSGAENAQFSPGSSEGPSPSFSYKVVNAPQGGLVKVTVKFTSTAGVGEGSWTQPTEQGVINNISGTFTQWVNNSGSVLEWTGGAAFERATPAFLGGPNGSFQVKPGTYTVVASGNGMFLGAPMCSMSGSAQFPLSSQGSIFVSGAPPEMTAPYEYSFSLSSEGVPMMPITLSGCPPEAKELEKTYEWPVAFSLEGNGISDDGITFAGSETESGGGITRESSWSFTGTE